MPVTSIFAGAAGAGDAESAGPLDGCAGAATRASRGIDLSLPRRIRRRVSAV
jgi:hypothetical protein